MRRIFLGSLFLVAGVLACGSVDTSTDALDAGSSDGSASDSGSDGSSASDGGANDGAPADSGGPTACGSASCPASEYCIVPCSGGVLPVCIASSNGACPENTQPGQCLGDAGPTPNGCVTKPPPPYCSPNPTCASGSGRATGRRIDCICA